MRERDEGSAPNVNERVPYAAVVVPERKGLLQGDRIEHPDYITEQNLQVDYLFYLTNQIKNPTVQFLELLVDDAEEIFNEAINIENNRRKGNVSIAKYFNVKGKKSQLDDLSVKRKSQNVAKYYLNEKKPDISKLGLDIDEDKNNVFSESSDSEEEIEKPKNNEKYKKLFLDLSTI